MARTVVELSAVAIAILLQGPVGLGTIILAFTLGQIVQVSNKLMLIIYEKIK